MYVRFNSHVVSDGLQVNSSAWLQSTYDTEEADSMWNANCEGGGEGSQSCNRILATSGGINTQLLNVSFGPFKIFQCLL
jgi:hypothetical protein